MAENINFTPRQSFAGAFEPGDATRYEMVVVEMWDTYEVIVLNDGFFDRICFLKNDLSECYETHRRHMGLATNPWTIKAARIMLDEFLKRKSGCQL